MSSCSNLALTVLFLCCLPLLCYRLSFFSTTPTDWLWRTSPKWPILCRVGRKALTRSIKPCLNCERTLPCKRWRDDLTAMIDRSDWRHRLVRCIDAEAVTLNVSSEWRTSVFMRPLNCTLLPVSCFNKRIAPMARKPYAPADSHFGPLRWLDHGSLWFSYSRWVVNQAKKGPISFGFGDIDNIFQPKGCLPLWWPYGTLTGGLDFRNDVSY